MSEKLVTYFYDDGSFGWLCAGDLENLLEIALKANLESLEDGETMDISFKRQDMTQAEIDALPEV